MLTIEKLKAMKQNAIFACGEGFIIHPWFNQAKNLYDEFGMPDSRGRHAKVHWVGIRGISHDWTIYHSLDANFEHASDLDGESHLQVSNERIARGGSKLWREEDIKKFVLCDEEAYEMYRHR